jgi:hypothetical protein
MSYYLWDVIRCETFVQRVSGKDRRGMLCGRGSNREAHLNMPVEAIEDRDQPVNGKPGQVGMADAGQIRRLDAGQLCRGGPCQTTLPQNTDDLGRQVGLDQLSICLRQTHILKGVVASPDKFQVFTYVNISCRCSEIRISV